MKISSTAPHVEELGPSVLSLPTTLIFSASPLDRVKETLCPPAPVCEDKKCCDWATCDLSLRAQECPTLTSGDRCKVMCAVGDTESAVFFIGSLLNSLAVSVVSQDWNGIAFLESCYFHCPDGHVPVNVHRLPVLDSTALLSGTLRLFIPFAERCLHRAVCFLKTTSWRAWIALI